MVFSETETKLIEELVKRDGRSFTQIAEAIGISERQLYRLKQKPAIKAAIKQASDEASSEIVTLAMPDITKAMVKKAANGDVKAAQLLFQMQGMLIDRKEITATTTTTASTYDDLSKQEIDDRMKEIQRKLEAERPRTIIDVPSPHSDKDYGFN